MEKPNTPNILTLNIHVDETHLEQALKARDNSETRNTLQQCILGQAAHLKGNDFIGFRHAQINGVRYKVEQPLGLELQHAFIWDTEKCRTMLPVSVKLTPEL